MSAETRQEFALRRLKDHLATNPGVDKERAVNSFLEGFKAGLDHCHSQVQQHSLEADILRQENKKLSDDWKTVVSRIASLFNVQKDRINDN